MPAPSSGDSGCECRAPPSDCDWQLPGTRGNGALGAPLPAARFASVWWSSQPPAGTRRATPRGRRVGAHSRCPIQQRGVCACAPGNSRHASVYRRRPAPAALCAVRGARARRTCHLCFRKSQNRRLAGCRSCWRHATASRCAAAVCRHRHRGSTASVAPRRCSREPTRWPRAAHALPRGSSTTTHPPPGAQPFIAPPTAPPACGRPRLTGTASHRHTPTAPAASAIRPQRWTSVTPRQPSPRRVTPPPRH